MQNLKPNVVENTVSFAKSISLAEVGVRAFAEISFNFIMVAIIRSIFQKLSDRAKQVAAPLSNFDCSLKETVC